MLTAVMTDTGKRWRGEELGKLELGGFLFHTDCVNIVIIKKMERIVKTVRPAMCDCKANKTLLQLPVSE